jgi:hypothetical protein
MHPLHVVRSRLAARRSAVAAVLTSLVLTVVVVAPAAAGGLTKVRSQYPLVFPGTVDCGTFQDDYLDMYDVTEIDVYDSSGTLLRIEYHAEHTSIDRNSVTGFTLEEHGHFLEVDDYITGTITITGNSEVANRKGAGVVIQDTGRVIYDANFDVVFFAGGQKHSQIVLGEGIWCDALS